jgi:hypothetical protein
MRLPLAPRLRNSAISSPTRLRSQGPKRSPCAATSARCVKRDGYPHPRPQARRARRHVFDSLAGYIHQSLLHRPGKGERRLVVRHDRRAGVRADADAGRQAERQRYRHGQIALTHWRAIDELDERQPHPQAVRTFAPSNRRTFLPCGKGALDGCPPSLRQTLPLCFGIMRWWPFSTLSQKSPSNSGSLHFRPTKPHQSPVETCDHDST